MDIVVACTTGRCAREFWIGIMGYDMNLMIEMDGDRERRGSERCFKLD